MAVCPQMNLQAICKHLLQISLSDNKKGIMLMHNPLIINIKISAGRGTRTPTPLRAYAPESRIFGTANSAFPNKKGATLAHNSFAS